MFIRNGHGQTETRARSGPPLRPVAVWPSSAIEVTAAFDRPIGPALAQAFVGKPVPYFEHGANRPGGHVEPLGRLPIVGARLLDRGRTLVLATGPHPLRARYSLPASANDDRPLNERGADRAWDYTLNGAEVHWTARDDRDPAGPRSWSGWWPRLDLDSARALARSSKAHETGLALLDRPGRIILSTFWLPPEDAVALRIDASGPIGPASLGEARPRLSTTSAPARGHRAEWRLKPGGGPQWLNVAIRTGEGAGPFALDAAYRSANRPVDRPIAADQLWLPWAPMDDTSPSAVRFAAPLAVPNLSGGDPTRGRELFRGDQGRCSQCHSFRGQDGTAGPDLTDIGRQSAAAIYRSIAAPSASIAPEYTTYTVADDAGRVFVGLLRANGPDRVQVIDGNAHVQELRRAEVRTMRPSATSIMPPGLAAALGDTAVRDLIAYLTAPPPMTVRP